MPLVQVGGPFYIFYALNSRVLPGTYVHTRLQLKRGKRKLETKLDTFELKVKNNYNDDIFGCAQLGGLGRRGEDETKKKEKKGTKCCTFYFQLARLALINCHLPSLMLTTGAVWSFFYFIFFKNTNLMPKFLTVSVFLLFHVSTTLHCYSRKSVTDVFPFISWRWWWGGSGGL